MRTAQPQLRPAKRPITLAASPDPHGGLLLQHLERRDGPLHGRTPDIPGVTTCLNKALTLPLVFDPGERWDYGINIDWVGKAVEAASGQRLDAYLKDHLFAPLGMNDTGFKSARRHARSASSACISAAPTAR